MTAELKYMDVSVQNLEVMQYKKTQARVVSSEKLTLCKTIYLLQIGLYMRHFCTPNIGLIFENKQLS